MGGGVFGGHTPRSAKAEDHDGGGRPGGGHGGSNRPAPVRGALATHFRHRPRMWCRCPSITKPMPRAIVSWIRSISGLLNSKISPHMPQMKWSW